MASVLKLVCGIRELNLIRATPTTAGWALREGGANMSPPRGQVVYGGNSIGGGARRTGSSMDNRDIVLTMSVQNVAGMSIFLRTLRDVFDFFQDATQAQESGARDSVYLVHQMDEGFTATSLLGRGPLYHEVLAGHLDMPTSAYSVYLVAGTTQNVLEATLTLTCLPYGVGKPPFLAEGTGWYRYNENNDLHIWAGTTNLLLNPSFEHATYLTDWAASAASLTTACEYERVHQPRDTITFQGCRLCNTDAALNRWLYSTKTLTAANYALSCYAYTDGGAVTSADLALYAGTAGGETIIATTYTADPDNPGWYRLTPTAGYFTADAVARVEGVVVYPGKTVIVDNFQLELAPAATPLALGDQGPGLAYSGTVHNSTSVRTAGQWRMRTQ